MSVSVYIIGLKEPAPDYLAKLKAYKACEEANVEPPPELLDYFDGVQSEYIPGDGMEVEIDEAVNGDVEYGDGAVIDLSKLPEGVTKIRVYMS
jgi:hypothetical protein